MAWQDEVNNFGQIKAVMYLPQRDQAETLQEETSQHLQVLDQQILLIGVAGCLWLVFC